MDVCPNWEARCRAAQPSPSRLQVKVRFQVQVQVQGVYLSRSAPACTRATTVPVCPCLKHSGSKVEHVMNKQCSPCSPVQGGRHELATDSVTVSSQLGVGEVQVQYGI